MSEQALYGYETIGFAGRNKPFYKVFVVNTLHDRQSTNIKKGEKPGADLHGSETIHIFARV